MGFFFCGGTTLHLSRRRPQPGMGSEEPPLFDASALDAALTEEAPSLPPPKSAAPSAAAPSSSDTLLSSPPPGVDDGAAALFATKALSDAPILTDPIPDAPTRKRSIVEGIGASFDALFNPDKVAAERAREVEEHESNFRAAREQTVMQKITEAFNAGKRSGLTEFDRLQEDEAEEERIRAQAEQEKHERQNMLLLCCVSSIALTSRCVRPAMRRLTEHPRYAELEARFLGWYDEFAARHVSSAQSFVVQQGGMLRSLCFTATYLRHRRLRRLHRRLRLTRHSASSCRVARLS